MSFPKNILNYTPAQVTQKKECTVSFYCVHPGTDKMERVRYRCNRIKNKKLQRQHALQLCKKINIMLEDGWNPFITADTGKSYTLLRIAVENFYNDKAQDLRTDSIRSYRSYVRYFLRWLENKDNSMLAINFSKQHAFQLLDSLSSSNKKISNNTYNNYLKFFRSLFNWLIEREFCTVNHFNKISTRKKETKKRVVISVEYKSIIQNHLEAVDPYFWAVCTLCYSCLIRPKEILMLKINNFNLDKRLITIPAKVAKNGKERMVVMPNLAYEALLKIELDKVSDSSLSAFSIGYKPGKITLSSRDIGKTWQHLRKELNLPENVSFYSLKDTGITDLLDAGVSSKIVQAHADHSSLAMTEKYNHKNFNLYEATIKGLDGNFT